MTLACEHLVYRDEGFTLTAHLTLKHHHRYALLAPSGAGKSTFLELLAGFLTPAQGHLWWEGQPLETRPVTERPISYLFQQNNLFAHLTVAQNLSLVHRDRRAVGQALQSVGLEEAMLTRLPHELSGGQQQRVALARTLLMNRPIMLLDEPFSALDPNTKEAMCALTLQLQRQHGWLVVAVTHDPADVERLQAQRLTIEHGQVVFA